MGQKSDIKGSGPEKWTIYSSGAEKCCRGNSGTFLGACVVAKSGRNGEKKKKAIQKTVKRAAEPAKKRDRITMSAGPGSGALQYLVSSEPPPEA